MKMRLSDKASSFQHQMIKLATPVQNPQNSILCTQSLQERDESKIFVQHRPNTQIEEWATQEAIRG